MKYIYQQYEKDKNFKIKHNYLSEQFNEIDDILADISKVVERNAFTFGEEIEIFENKFASKINSKFCISVSSGTMAITLALKALDIGPGDEVIAPSFTFHATIGAIAATGARPVLADVSKDFNIDPKSIQTKISNKTRAIIVVHWSGRICDMNEIKKLIKEDNISIIEDACHAFMASADNEFAGNIGDFGCFSLHPLKNINVWGDGGMIVTSDYNKYKKIQLLRNHGLIDRDRMEMFGFNARLDTIQAVVGNHFLSKIDNIIYRRIENAIYLDEKLKNIGEIKLPARSPNIKETFQLYVGLYEKRDLLLDFLQTKGIDAKIHYPIPMHLQKPLQKIGYKKGDFPESEYLAKNTLSLPVHEFVKKEDLDYMIKNIKKFYSR